MNEANLSAHWRLVDDQRNVIYVVDRAFTAPAMTSIQAEMPDCRFDGVGTEKLNEVLAHERFTDKAAHHSQIVHSGHLFAPV